MAGEFLPRQFLYMGYINQLLTKLSALNIDSVAESIMVQTEQSLEEIQREQMLHGINSAGNPIGLYKQDEYARYKQQLNPLPGYGIVDLKRTGKFYAGISVYISGDDIVIESTDEKSQTLEEKYNDDEGSIFGISDEFKKRYVSDSLYPEFKTEIENRIGLRFST